MSELKYFYETKRWRCLHFQKPPMEGLYLKYCGVEECLKGQYFDATGRDAWHLHVILSGKGSLVVENKENKLHFGQMFITKPGEACFYYADSVDPWSYCWMTFDGTRAEKFVQKAGFVRGVNYLECHADTNQFYRMVERILKNPEMSLANDLMSQGILLEYVALAIQSNYSEKKTVHRVDEYTADDYVRRAMSLMESNYATVKVADVADKIGLNRSYLSSLFKKNLGISPQEYLLQCRMKSTKYFLEKTDISIQEIAKYVGYGDPMTFSKWFKKEFNIKPTDYRQLCRSKKTEDNCGRIISDTEGPEGEE